MGLLAVRSRRKICVRTWNLLCFHWVHQRFAGGVCGVRGCAFAKASTASAAAPGVTDRTATPTVILCAWGMEFDSCVQVCTSPRPPRRLVGPITGSSGLGPRGVRLRPRNPFSHQQKHQNKGIRKWICGISLGNTHRRTRGSMLELCVLTVVSPRGG